MEVYSLHAEILHVPMQTIWKSTHCKRNTPCSNADNMEVYSLQAEMLHAPVQIIWRSTQCKQKSSADNMEGILTAGKNALQTTYRRSQRSILNMEVYSTWRPTQHGGLLTAGRNALQTI